MSEFRDGDIFTCLSLEGFGFFEISVAGGDASDRIPVRCTLRYGAPGLAGHSRSPSLLRSIMKRRKPMTWALFFAILVWLLALLPLVYSSFWVHKSLTWRLWGYAPNQYFFMALPFFLAALGSFGALFHTVLAIKAHSNAHWLLKHLALNWPATILVGITITGVVTLVDFYNTPKSLDKLQRRYAERAMDAAASLHQKFESESDLAKRTQLRREIIAKAQELKVKNLAVIKVDPSKLDQVDDATYLQIAQDARLQNELGLLDPTDHALQVFQTFVVLMVAWCVVVSAGLCLALQFSTNYSPSLSQHFPKVLTGLYLSVICFAIWVVCYRQLRMDMEYVTGTMTGSLRIGDVVGIFLIIGLITWILNIDPSVKDIQSALSTYIVPFVFVGCGYAAQFMPDNPVRLWLGVGSSPGNQILFHIVLSVISLPSIIRLFT